MKKEIEVVGAIIVNKNKVLCAQRGKTKTLAYKWEFPGGKIEIGEKPREALIRELSEELQVTIKVSKESFEVTRYDYDFAIVNLTTFLCELENSSKLVLTEHNEIKWLTIHQLSQLDWAPADIPAVEKLMKIKKLEIEYE